MADGMAYAVAGGVSRRPGGDSIRHAGKGGDTPAMAAAKQRTGSKIDAVSGAGEISNQRRRRLIARGWQPAAAAGVTASTANWRSLNGGRRHDGVAA